MGECDEEFGRYLCAMQHAGGALHCGGGLGCRLRPVGSVGSVGCWAPTAADSRWCNLTLFMCTSAPTLWTGLQLNLVQGSCCWRRVLHWMRVGVTPVSVMRLAAGRLGRHGGWPGYRACLLPMLNTALSLIDSQSLLVCIGLLLDLSLRCGYAIGSVAHHSDASASASAATGLADLAKRLAWSCDLGLSATSFVYMAVSSAESSGSATFSFLIP